MLIAICFDQKMFCEEVELIFVKFVGQIKTNNNPNNWRRLLGNL